MDLLKNLDDMITAEEFLKNNEEYYMEIEESPEIFEMMIEFAKMHVEKFAEIHNIKNIKYIEEIK